MRCYVPLSFSRKAVLVAYLLFDNNDNFNKSSESLHIRLRADHLLKICSAKLRFLEIDPNIHYIISKAVTLLSVIYYPRQIIKVFC